MFSFFAFILISGQIIDFTTDATSTDKVPLDTHRSGIGTKTINVGTKRPTRRPSNDTITSSKSTSNKTNTGLNALTILLITVFILLLVFVLLLIVRRYFNAKKWNSNRSTLDTHSIKYISDKKLNKSHIDMNAENAHNCEKANSESSQRQNGDCDSQIDANSIEYEQNKNKSNMLNRVKKQLCRPTLLAAAGRYRKFNNVETYD